MKKKIYKTDVIGNYMTTNYVCIKARISVCEAMNELIHQAGIHDNIMMIYVTDEKEHLVGAVNLKDLIIARQQDDLETLIIHSYPRVRKDESVENCIEFLLDYAEESLPVIDDEDHLVGTITAENLVEIINHEMGNDYAKLAGLTAAENATETASQSMKKRLPWLIVLLFLGMLVSSVVGVFEGIVAVLPIIICFQSLVLDMAGNVGTQSLAVTIRALMNENITGKEKLQLLGKEVMIGLLNGCLLGIMTFFFLGIYIKLYKGYDWIGALSVSGCVGIALMIAMLASGLVGAAIPMLFHKLKIDPAAASGPLITTINDLVAVITYYGLAYLFLVS